MQAQSTPVEITTKNGTKWEKGVAQRVQGLLEKHDLSKWIFTNKVMVEDDVIPHSHPVLTLSTRKQNDDGLLSTFIHEQLHWYVDARPEGAEKAIAEFRKKYKNVPVRNGRGARDEYSTYMHLMVCYLEYKSVAELIGEESARKTIQSNNHYTWIYETIIKDQKYIGKVVADYQLNLVD